MNSSAPLPGGKEPPQQTLPWIHHPGRKNGNTPLTAGASGELFCVASCGASTALSFTEMHIYEPAEVRLHFWWELLLPACSRGGKGDLHRVCLQSAGPCQANPRGSGGQSDLAVATGVLQQSRDGLGRVCIPRHRSEQLQQQQHIWISLLMNTCAVRWSEPHLFTSQFELTFCAFARVPVLLPKAHL